MQARHFGDGYKTEIQLNTLNMVIKSYFKDIFTAFYEANEALSAQDFGTYITRLFYDDRLNQISKLAPVLQNKSKVLIDGYGACLGCDFEGQPEDFSKTRAAYPQCPECGSFKTTKMLHPTVVTEPEVVDVHEIVQGDLSGALLPFPACFYDMSKMAHDSPHFLYEQSIPLRLAHSICGRDLEIPSFAHGGDHYGLEVMQQLAARGGNVEGHGVNNLYGSASIMSEKAVLSEMWLEPEWYAGFKLDAPERTVSGMIPANVPFEEIYPKGVCIVGFGDMNLQIGVYSEKKHIASGVYYVQSFSGVGKGVSDGVDIARDLSEVHSMAMATLKRYGAAGTFHAKDTITPAQVKDLFKPQRSVPIDLKGSGMTDIHQAVGQLQINPVNPALGAYAVQLSNLLNLVNLSGDFSEGSLQSVDINTLGGQQLATAKEEGKKGAILSMKVAHRQLCAEHLAELHREHIKLPRYYAAETDRHAATKGKWVSGTDLPERVKFDAVPDSELPQNAYEKRSAAKEMVQQAGGLGNLMQLAQMNPRLTAWYAAQFNAELPMINQEEIWLVCLARLDSIKRNSQIYQNPADVLTALDKPLFVREYGHLMKAEFLGQLLDDDEVATWNPGARAAVQMLIEQHYTMQATAAFQDESLKQKVAMQLQAEGAQMQNEINAPAAAAQNQQADAEGQKQLLLEGASRVADDEQKSVDHDRALEVKESDHARALELEDVRAKNADRAAKPNSKLLRGKN